MRSVRARELAAVLLAAPWVQGSTLGVGAAAAAQPQEPPIEEVEIQDDLPEGAGEPEAGLEDLGSGRLGALRFRSIGPALPSGRIGDFAVNPQNPGEWYVAVSSGGVWKTTNAGTTFEPIFDGEGSYSIGVVEIDPNNPNVIWVGTGENNSQRSVSFGDGVYKSVDGGKSWRNVGLEKSEHIGMIAIDPRNSDTVYVAAQGPLWNAGGERGLYKTTDGGRTWVRVLHISDDTGVNEVHMDPRDPDRLYASAYQRRRRPWTLIDGGPESAIYKSTDAGRSWRKINRGLPGGDLGRIGMAVSPVNPDVVYAIVTATEDRSGFYRSVDRGETWQRMSGYKTDSPQYYNEVYASPHDADTVYLADTFLNVSRDGGRTFGRVPSRNKHVDDHALWIDPNDPDHMLVGSDGGIYETFDGAQNWRYFDNLPVVQFYRVAVDNAEPFYNVYGGTQDNNTLGGPSRTADAMGIGNEHWFVTVGGDGFEPAVDPENPDIVYSQWQYGNLIRFDRASGERVDIKPREKPGEEPYVFNWDSPLLISPHSHTRLYFAGDRLFRSEDRGNSWEAISGRLTRGIDRNTLEVMGRIQPPEAVDKDLYTSTFGNVVALDESPVQEGLIYVGADDGLISVTEDGGESWRKVDAVAGVPHMTYVSDLQASLHDPDVVFATFDNHRNGDFTPYVMRSDDRGQTWTSIRGDLPDRHVAYSVVQDHVEPGLLFVGTEFGAFYTRDGGQHWHKIGGMPTIAVRDLEIQRREHDLVAATFGRGFYILDDYTPLRLAREEDFQKDAVIFPVKDALLYIPRARLGSGRGSQGANFYAASNPPYGAVFTYHLKDAPKTQKERRQEKPVTAETYPSLEQLRAEDVEVEPSLYMTIRDSAGEVVRRMGLARSKGVRRVSWDLRHEGVSPLGGGQGMLALPGTYTASIAQVVDGEVSELGEPVEFEVVPLQQATFVSEDPEARMAFHRDVAELYRAVQGASRLLGEARARLNAVRRVAVQTPGADLALLARLQEMQAELDAIGLELLGDRSASRRMYPTPPSIAERINSVLSGQWNVSSDPTQTQRDGYEYAAAAFEDVLARLRTLVEEGLPAVEAELEAAGAPWTPGRVPAWGRRGQ